MKAVFIDQPGDASALLDDSPDGMHRLLALLSSVKPVVPNTGGSYIQGPFVFADRGPADAAMTGDQEKVEQKLSQELLKLVRQRYPSYM